MASQETPTRMLRTRDAQALRFRAMAIEHIARMGVRIRQRREELSLTQEDVARAMPGKTTGNQVSRWERGANRPGDQQLEHLAKILKVDPAYFMAASPPAPDPPLAMFAEGDRLAELEAAVKRIEAKLDALTGSINRKPDAESIEAMFLDGAAKIAAARPPGQGPASREPRPTRTESR